MTGDAFASLPALPELERRDVFAAAARRLDTVPGCIEKDFWVCPVRDTLFNRLPSGEPKLHFNCRSLATLARVRGVEEIVLADSSGT